MTSLFLILIVTVILNCIWLNRISSRIGVPTLLAFIVLGIVFGNVGSIPVYLDNHSFAKEICSVALLFIMFYSGFGTRWESIRPVWRKVFSWEPWSVLRTRLPFFPFSGVRNWG